MTICLTHFSKSTSLLLKQQLSTSNHHKTNSPSSSSSLQCSSSLLDMEGATVQGLYPSQRCKTIHLVRHAQGFHNVEGEKDLSAYLSPHLFDANLTPLGWEQVDNLRKHVHSSGIAERVELVIVSPLLRTLQTAVGVFGGEGYTDGISVPPLMVENAGNSTRPAISSLNSPPLKAVELCREHVGVHWCDKRRSISEYKPLFHTLKAFGGDCHPTIKDEICKPFNNCELRSVVIVDRSLMGSDSPVTNYPGKIPSGADVPSDDGK